MKNFKIPVFLFFVFACAVLLFSCEQDDRFNETELYPEPGDESLRLKSAGTSGYMYDLYAITDQIVVSGYLNKGNSIALTNKIDLAIKSLNKGDKNGAITHLKTFVKQVNAFMKNGKLPEEEAQQLLKIAGNAQMLIKGSYTDIRDGKEYKVVLIGQQIWMAENLAYLPAVSPSSAGSYTDPLYYVYDYQGTNVAEAKLSANYPTYGALYNWPAARMASPSGWHLPAIDEWNQLAEYLNSREGPFDYEYGVWYFRWKDVGYHLKATYSWDNNGGGIDNYDFSALGGGSRIYEKIFQAINLVGYWWSDSEYEAVDSWSVLLDYWTNDLDFVRNYNENGFAIRCIKD